MSRNTIRVCIAVCMLVMIAAGSNALPRERTRLDAGWRFHLGELPGYTAAGRELVTITAWETKPAGGATAGVNVPNATDDGSWTKTSVGADPFNGRTGFAWFRATLNGAATNLPAAKLRLHFESVDDNATVYVNGKRLLHHEIWDEPFDVPLGSVWRRTGPNVVAVLVQNTAGQGGIYGRATLEAIPESTSGLGSASVTGAGWKSVHLPHDFVVDGPFDPTAERSHGFKKTGIGWYCKALTIPEKDRGRRLSLEFDGIYRDSMVWLNGVMLGRHASGYTSFAYDITKAARYGAKNTLVVRADARRNEGWWYEGGGIYRHVWLVKTHPVHVAHWGTFVTSTVRSSALGAVPSADVVIRTTLQNDLAKPGAYRVVSRIIDSDGRATANAVSLQLVFALKSAEVIQRIVVPKARLWSIPAPHMYRVLTSISQGPRVLDTYETPFGIRTIRFDKDQGFFLNGKPVKIKGTCNHQDFAGIGVALPDRVHGFKLEKLKAMGCNAVRCSHHPYAPEWLDACDRTGMLVMDENRKLGDSGEILGQVESMVRRDRNHPSVIMWSMCNEEGRQGSPEGARMFSAMKKVVRNLDTTRPVSCAMNGGWGKDGISMFTDLQGYNYHLDAYDGFHTEFPDIPMYASETASTTTTRGEYTSDRERGYVNSYRETDQTWKTVAERPFMAGSFVWTGFDYRGEPTPYDWPCVNSHFGIMDTCGFPKDNYYYYLSWWGAKPVVHLMPHWNWTDKVGPDITVRCFSNCDRVELLLNGQSLGTKDMPRYEHLDWKVPYKPGHLEARGYSGGTITARDVIETTGAPAAVRLRPDRKAVEADGQDVSIISVDILDAKGRVVPTAGNLVTFSVSGPGKVIGVGNGDPSSHEADKASKRRAFNGHCMVIVESGTTPGGITITATSPGLRKVSVVVHSRNRR